MKRYVCVFSNKDGKIVKSIRDGVSVESLQAALSEDGFYPISIIEKTDQSGSKLNKTSVKTLRGFTAVLSMLLDSGLSIRDGLEILKTISRDAKVTRLVSGIEKGLDCGYSFHSSIQSIGPSVPRIYGSMVKVGETTGDLAAVFRKLNSHLTRQKIMREKLSGSLIYPVIVLSAAVFSIIMISAYIIPSLSEIFIGIGAGVPEEVSRILYITRGAFRILLFGFPFLFVCTFLIFLLRKRSYTCGAAVDRIILKTPLIGGFVRDNILLNVLFILDALTACGVRVEDALEEVISTTGNKAVKESFTRVHAKVLKGINVSEAFGHEPIIPGQITKWVAVGERTGNMKTVFGQLTEYYEDELEKKSSRFMSLIEPALIIFTGMIVFATVLLIIIPLFSSFGMIVE